MTKIVSTIHLILVLNTLFHYMMNLFTGYLRKSTRMCSLRLLMVTEDQMNLYRNMRGIRDTLFYLPAKQVRGFMPEIHSQDLKQTCESSLKSTMDMSGSMIWDCILLGTCLVILWQNCMQELEMSYL